MSLVALRHVKSSWIKTLESVSPALPGWFFTTELPGKPKLFFFLFLISKHFCLFFNFLATLYSTWNLSSPTRGWTHNPCVGSAESYHWTTGEVPHLFLLECSHSLKQSGWVFISIFAVGFGKSKCEWRNRCLKSWHYFLYVKVYFFHIIYTFFFSKLLIWL